MREHAFHRLSAFRVRRENAREFELIFGRRGAWEALLAGAPGFVRSELWRDAEDRTLYLTSDLWRSRREFDAFRRRCSAEVAKVEERIARLGQLEMLLGQERVRKSVA
ncbi:MAG TPA: antibiotic biosynthesis monooxygenase [Gemmatimonadaceae bacterium]|nr:antibiotic biosynthesis monooxygenase [Gemmatimonadaceae bacterium]